MQAATLKHWDVAPNPEVLRIWRPSTRERPHQRTVAPSAAAYKPAGKWTVVAAFVLAVVLHAAPVVWVEMQQEEPSVATAVPALLHPLEEVIFQKGAGTDTAGPRTGTR